MLGRRDELDGLVTGGAIKVSEKQKEYGDLLLTLMGEWLVVLIEKDVDQAHISCEDIVEQKLVICKVGDGIPQKTRGLRKR